MVRRTLAVVMAAVAAVSSVGSSVAHGDEVEQAPRERPAAVGDEDVVTLLTGDRVRLTPRGKVLFVAGKGRKDVRHMSLEVPGEPADRVIVPDDAFDKVASGEWDARLFNVDALRRAGVGDAREIKDASALGRNPLSANEPIVGGEPSERVTIELIGRDGGAPTRGVISYSDLTDPSNSGIALTSDGEASFDLAPGPYGFVFGMRSNFDDGSWEVTGAVADITVGSTPVLKTVDARKGNQVNFSLLDRSDAVQQYMSVNLNTYLYDGQKAYAGQGWGIRPGDRLYGIPSQINGHRAGMMLDTQFLSPEGTPTEERYSYNLAKPVLNGIPQDLSFRIADDDLARIDVNYQAPAVPTRGQRRNDFFYQGQSAGGVGGSNDMVDLPGARTEYYTADPDVSWTHRLSLINTQADEYEETYLAIARDGGSYRPGSRGQRDFFKTGSSMAVGRSSYLWVDSSSVHETTFSFSPAPFSAGPPDQETLVGPIRGSASVSFNGSVIYDGPSSDGGVRLGGWYGSTVPAEDGRYTVKLAGAPGEDVVWLHPGSSYQGEWAFDVRYAEGYTPFNVGAVRFTSDGIVDSHAQAGSTIDVELIYAARPGVATPTCTAMTFEVSFDDGATWEPVDITRDGNNATASVTHPTDAQYASLRFTAADEAGNTVKHTTIRSYGLR